jgi:exodeoxyribonuclease V alpha subunit
MMRNQPSNTLADLQGQIERITYTNDETGFTIAKLKVYGQRDLVTID